MSFIWNLLDPTRKKIAPLAKSGREFLGTVISHGLTDKTVKVRVSFQHWNFKFARYLSRNSNFLVHDSENFCRTGDKVVIRLAIKKISKRKAYYVRNVFKAYPRQTFYESINKEKRELFEVEYRKALAHYYTTELRTRSFDTKMLELEAKKGLREKAKLRASENVKRILTCLLYTSPSPRDS
eukprot:TRINITY_DN3360_c0_g1_i1.p1 TRINITY_DN3360_c0_g1~~TRINITY_DN3360_c0_g1_i1.p1  ORF type:complete len:182 (+),score=43.47 TRINITY_DN3360_c0_g1_i1:35-580(+)